MNRVKLFIDWIVPYELIVSLKFELRILAMRVLNFLNPYYRYKLSKLRKIETPKIHFACGTRYIEGWINIDGLSKHKHDLTLDLRRKIPLQKNKAAAIFCEHFIEHLNHPHGVTHFLNQCYQILKPGGILRISVPDAGLYLKNYSSANDLFFKQERPDCHTKMEAINHVFRQAGQHRWAYDFEELSRTLKASNFTEITAREFGMSGIKNFEFDSPNRQGESLYIEAKK